MLLTTKSGRCHTKHSLLSSRPASPQAGALCGAPQSNGAKCRVRADAGAAPSTPEGAAALVAARLLGAKCVREAVGRALAELQGLRAVAAGKAEPPSQAPGDAATGSPVAARNRQPGPPAASGHSEDADGAAAIGAVGLAHHRDKRQRREASAAPEPAGTAAGSAAGAVPPQHVSADDDYMGDVSDVSMSDDEGNDATAQRQKGQHCWAGSPMARQRRVQLRRGQKQSLPERRSKYGSHRILRVASMETGQQRSKRRQNSCRSRRTGVLCAALEFSCSLSIPSAAPADRHTDAFAIAAYAVHLQVLVLMDLRTRMARTVHACKTVARAGMQLLRLQGAR